MMENKRVDVRRRRKQGLRICLLLFMIISQLSLVHSQEFSGQVLNSKTKQPIAYVSIGIPALAAGILSDEEGRFQITLQSIADTDTLHFSIIGYSSAKMAVSDFKNAAADAGILIYLNEKSYSLKEVSVRPRNLKFKTMGKTKSKLKRDDCFLLYTFLDTLQGYMVSKKHIQDFPNKHIEIGSYFNIKPRETFIEKVNLQFCDWKFDSIKLRLNVYSNFGSSEQKVVRFDNNDKITVLNTPIYFTVTKGTENYEIDLKPYSIKVTNDFVVSIETLEPQDCHKLLLPCYLFSSGPDMVYRYNHEQNYFYKLAVIKLALSVTMGYEK